ncbi:MAG TPA: hypothetical protein VJU86_08005 [Pyrinomonadaceae bacterium]|nr:hypothetical protein [Pyrinomonadaceae bacterium]
MLISCAALIAFSAGEHFAAQRKAKPARTTPTQRSKPQPAPKRSPEPEVELEKLPPDPSVESADVAITANVRAKSLRFETVPNPTVTFPGSHKLDTVWEAQRENLPTPVEPGVTYRNIGIRLKITSVFADIDRIVAEALGEVPVTKDASPPPVEPPKKPATEQVPSPTAAPVRPRSPKK